MSKSRTHELVERAIKVSAFALAFARPGSLSVLRAHRLEVRLEGKLEVCAVEVASLFHQRGEGGEDHL